MERHVRRGWGRGRRGEPPRPTGGGAATTRTGSALGERGYSRRRTAHAALAGMHWFWLMDLGSLIGLMKARNSILLIAVALVVATVVVYLPVGHHEFVNFDDDQFVTENPNLRDGLTWRSVRWAFTAGLKHDDPYSDFWRPLSYLSHAVDVEMFGLRPAGHHLMNVGFHAAAVVALFLVLQSMTHAPWRCAFVAALFALHPLRVESVAWVTERKDVMSGLFFILTLGAYVRYARHPFSWGRYLAVAFLFALGLMSKPMVVTLPFVLLLLDYWPLGRTRWAEPVVAGNVRVSPGRLFVEKLPLFGLAAASGVMTFLGRAGPGAGGLLARIPLGTRIGNALLTYVGCIGKMVWPVGLAVFYPLHPGLNLAAVIAAGVGLGGVTAAVIWGARRKPWLVTGWFWYLGMLVPVSGLLQGLGESMADRFTYLPSIGLLIMVGWSAPARVMERRNARVITGVAAAALVAICAGLSMVQIGYWENSETLFRHALEVTRDNWLAHCNLARDAEREGRMGDAIRQYEQAVQIRPKFAEAQISLGVALCQAGRIPEGVKHFEEALRIEPDNAAAHNNLGLVLCQGGEVQKGIGQYEEALRIEPNYAEAESNFGSALLQEGKFEEAIGHFERAVRIAPEYAEAEAALGFAYGHMGKVEEAIRHYEQAVRIRPDYAVVYYNLGATLEGAGRVPEAIAQYEQALRVKPDFEAARNRLARLQGRG